MAQSTAAMGPPLSPRETRRSGRRSAHSQSNSTSASKSSGSPPTESRTKDSSSARPSSTNNPRNAKRLKQEEIEDGVEYTRRSTAASSASSSSGPTPGNGRSKRKGKDKEKNSVDPVPGSTQTAKSTGSQSRDLSVSAPEEEEQGVTRCICGSTEEDDPDAGEFMVQCETCKAWQHGLCMGYEAEDQLPDDDYHCEQCRPDLHIEIKKRKSSKRPRHPSTALSHTATAMSVAASATASRLSRSHSPSYALKPAKRRNTMNSRDANFETIFKETLAATAAEAEAAAHEDPVDNNNNPDEEEDADGDAGRRRRKKAEDDASKKRVRSASSVSDHVANSAAPKDDPPPPSKTTATQTKSSSSRNRRGGARKSAAAAAVIIQEVGALDAEDAPAPPKRSSNSNRNRSSHASRRPPSHAQVHVTAPALSHSDSRRANISASAGPSAGGSGGGSTGGVAGAGGGSTMSSAAYRASHAYAVSQQPLFTSWGLPDYLSHLEEMLPSEVPKPLEVRGSGLGGDTSGGGTERGVKVKWPSKRMSVGDMNKRVRALVEWVGREQAALADRDRRREALEARMGASPGKASSLANRAPRVARDSKGDDNGDPEGVRGDVQTEPGEGGEKASRNDGESDAPAKVMIGEKSTMRMMEELMEELIGFQERFGPGVKTRERERRVS